MVFPVPGAPVEKERSSAKKVPRLSKANSSTKPFVLKAVSGTAGTATGSVT